MKQLRSFIQLVVIVLTIYCKGYVYLHVLCSFDQRYYDFQNTIALIRISYSGNPAVYSIYQFLLFFISFSVIVLLCMFAVLNCLMTNKIPQMKQSMLRYGIRCWLATFRNWTWLRLDDLLHIEKKHNYFKQHSFIRQTAIAMAIKTSISKSKFCAKYNRLSKWNCCCKRSKATTPVSHEKYDISVFAMSLLKAE